MICFLFVSSQKTVVLIGFHSNNHKSDFKRSYRSIETFYNYVNLLNLFYLIQKSLKVEEEQEFFKNSVRQMKNP